MPWSNPYFRSPIDEVYRLPRQQSPGSQPLSPAEEDSLLGQITGGAMTGLQWLGGLLDKTFGGRAIRGTLGGKPEELLSLIPGSDTLGITNPANRVGGEDLLKSLGIDTGSETLNTIGGIGTEIALDPATYLTFGASAITPAGKVAKQLGVLPKTALGRIQGLSTIAPETAALASRMGVDVTGMLNKPLGGLLGLGLPLSDPAAVLGTGQMGEKIAGALGRAGEAVKYSGPGRAFGALFDPAVEGTRTAPIQRELRSGRAEELARALPEARDSVAKLYQDLTAAGPYDPLELRKAMEGLSPQFPAEAQRAKQFLADELAQRQAAGLPSSELVDRYAGYFPRQPVPLEREYLPAGTGKPLGTHTGAMEAREKVWRDIPGGTETVEAMLEDPRIAGLNRTLSKGAARETIAQDYLFPRAGYSYDPAVMGQLRDFQRANPGVVAPIAPDVLEQLGLWGKSGQLSRRLGRMQPERVGPEGAGLFANDPLLDLLGHSESSAKAVANANAIRRVFTDPATLAAGASSAESVPLTAALRRAGFAKDARDLFLNDLVMAGQLPPTATVKDLKNVLLPADVVADATRLRDTIKLSEAVNAPLRAFDSATAVNKAFQTALWPAFHVRNLVSSTWQSLSGGSAPARLAEATGMEAALRSGKPIEGLAAKLPEFAGMSDAEATAALGREMFSQRAAGRGLAQMWQNAADTTGRDLGRLIPGQKPEPSLLEILKAAGKGRTDAAGQPIDSLAARLDPRNVAGYGGFLGQERRNVDQFAPLVAGRQAAEGADDLTRGAMYIERRLGGYSPQAAAEATSTRHFDYANMLTDFERKIVRRLAPFYCVPDDSEILTRDGWKRYEDLILGEEVMTYNGVTDRMEWQRLEAVHAFEHDEELSVIETPRYKLRFTTEHKWVAKRKPSTERRPYGRRIYEYPETRGLVPGDKLTSEYMLLVAAEFEGEESLLSPRDAAVLGWLVTDGYTRVRPRSPRHVEGIVYQSPKKYLQEIIAVTAGTPRKPHPQTGVVPVRVPKETMKRLRPYLDKSNLPSVVTRLSRAAADAMYEAMLKAEGSFSKGTWQFAQHKSRGVMDAFRILAAMLGKRTSTGKTACYVSPRRYLGLANKTRRYAEHYRGIVWCPRTANGTWLMRQSGMITITGNTWSKGNVPLVAGDLLREPGGLNAMGIRAAADARGDQGFLPGYMGAGMAIPLGPEEGGQRKYLARLDLPFEDPAGFITPGPTPTRSFFEKLAGQLNPLLKGPLEMLTGRQFYANRELNDAYSQTGSVLGDQLLMNLPTARVVTTGRQLADERKSVPERLLNVLTGAKVSDVDVEKGRANAVRDLLESYMRSDSNFRKNVDYNVPADQVATLTPEELAVLRLARQMQREAQAAAKAKK